MGLFRCDIYSEELDKNTSFYVSTPKPEDREDAYDRDKRYQTLYLLHGGGDDFTKWVRRVPIERITREYKIAVVMPDASLSFYADVPGMANFYSYIAHELPKIVELYFPVSNQREDRFIAGLSMGGYGAFRIALKNPECYGAAASFSGALEVTMLPEILEANHHPLDFDIQKPENQVDCDLLSQITKLLEADREIPSLYQSCGTKDFIYDMNKAFQASVLSLPKKLDYTYEEWDGYHDWEFWDEALHHALEWFPLKRNYVRR